MGMLALQRLMSEQRDRQRRRRQIFARNPLIASPKKRKCLPCPPDADLQAGATMRCSIPELPEDIWRHIHSLMPMRDAAHAACLSLAFLRSWRCYPNLTFTESVFPEAHRYGRDLSHTVDSILRNHSGIGVKIFNFELYGTDDRNVDNWLQVAVTPGIEELTLRLPSSGRKIKYKFPCSLLSDGVRKSIWCLELSFCIFRPTAALGHLASLTSLQLCYVRITGDELECLITNSLALEQLVLTCCKKIICLRVPCVLQRLSYLRVEACLRLKLIECKAPNLSTLDFCGKAKLSLGEPLQMKNLSIDRSNAVCYAPSSMPNLDTLTLFSYDEVVNTPMLPTKFPYLKHLTIHLESGTFSSSYDYFSLVSFLDASPSLETLILEVIEQPMEHESILGHSSHLRQMAEDNHRSLKNVKIEGFSSAKSLVELTCYILKNAVLLECLTLDTQYGSRCSDEGCEQCSLKSSRFLKEARRAVVAIRRYIEDKVPARVKWNVGEPCSRCHKHSH